VLRACDGHVETPFAAAPVQRSKIHRYFACLIGAVTDRKDDHIAFIPLDVLQIFDEYRLFGFIAKKTFDLGIIPPRLIQLIQNKGLLGLAEGNDTDQ